MSSAEALLPLNWLAAAARLTVSAAAPSALRVVGPNFSISSQNTTRMPLAAVENGTKPTLTASLIGKSSKNQGKRRVGETAGRGIESCVRRRVGPSSAWVVAHYGLPAAALPSTPWPPRHIR